MASAVQLAGDFQIGMSVCFLTNCPDLLLDNEALESYGVLEDTPLADLTELEGFSLLGYENSILVGSLFG